VFLFIFESIGTPELILIAVVALIIFGPRKLPQFAKSIGKTMSEFRNATNEFKSTWEKEVEFEDEGKSARRDNSLSDNSIAIENSVVAAAPPSEALIANQSPVVPQIRELTPEELPENFQMNEASAREIQTDENKIEKTAADKRDWL
jgi:TatA/E family protein of Tat protein translocase